jgi:ABC-type molybdenum transport system ATPase subunit/photorepair protein PhrA
MRQALYRMTEGPDVTAKDAQVDKNFLISEVTVSELFGRYSYRISPLTPREATLGAPPLMLLYGGNGSGKTTVLRILYHLLSSADDQGHRTRLAQIPFRTVVVKLGNGDTITVAKQNGLVGDIEISVVSSQQEAVVQKYSYDQQTRRVFVTPTSTIHAQLGTYTTTMPLFVPAENLDVIPIFGGEEDRYAKYLEGLAAKPVIIGDDRRMHSDNIDSDERMQRQRQRAREDSDPESSTVAAELAEAMRRTSDWFRQQLISGTEAGSQGADQIYLVVLKQIAKLGNPEERQSSESIQEALHQLEKRTLLFSEYGLVPHFRSRQFNRLLNTLDPEGEELAANIIFPYIEGQNARLDSLQVVERLLRTFLNNLRGYLGPEKRIVFSPQYGLRIFVGDHEYLSPRQLSSGERHLFLLLCNSMLARESGSLFLVDEPELSLNATWQRKLVGSLLECVAGANVQFIMATHSIEIITKHRQYLATLTPEDA